MSDIASHNLPTAPAELTAALKKRGLTDTIIQDGLFKDSASKIKFPQYLLFHSICPQRKDSTKLQVAQESDRGVGWLKKEYFEEASNFLDAQPNWNNYIDSIRDNPNTLPTNFDDDSFFTLLRYNQLLAHKMAKMHKSTPEPREDSRPPEEPGTPKTPPQNIEELSEGISGLQLSTPESKMSEASPLRGEAAKQEDPALSEQLVNFDFTLMPQCVTLLYRDLKADWSPYQFNFTFKVDGEKLFTARTDGGYALRDGGLPLALMETKPEARYGDNPPKDSTGDDKANKAIDKFKMQEVAQLVTWINEFPPNTQNNEQVFQRVNFSKNLNEIYINVATFKTPYVDYICGRSPSGNAETTDAPATSTQQKKGLAKDSLVSVQEYGPFTTTNFKHMRYLGKVFLGHSIQMANEVGREIAYGPSTSV